MEIQQLISENKEFKKERYRTNIDQIETPVLTLS
jgi:hypothetical protein